MPEFKLILSSGFVSEYSYWAQTNPKVAVKIDELVKAISADPFRGDRETGTAPARRVQRLLE